ncbi:hypothetical protein RRG08_041587 [Elysia crispata]|uniref:Uncharacterized protein n=1 Tax=Elysia crispata TaxID=231223 RepID=A0AAE1AZW3_9GAST|nr:hypothetical protein RRG08_041587 [Elysia crispata]
MAHQITSNTRTCVDIAILSLEGAVIFHILLRMLENLLHELGYAALDTECLAVILYLVLSAQLCLLLSWRWNAPANRRTNNTAATRKGALILSTYTAVLRLILLVEACLVLYGIAKAWTSLLWDITLVATVQAFVCAAIFIALDGSFRKMDRIHRVDALDDVLILRRRRPGG